ncbi:thiamine-phosphate pyrophosphorylase [Helicobacter bilis]|uniref:Thiamine-phosphate synthase n=1 Tax=Helicobacter bilis TaxID=37372 RepID=A0A1Q2LGB0_9HELI|nr:thiamine phosphate synthase [Helicobacter bilis]AQQ58962.1 thiamine-phosphate pyrophosphorylase [Helicobacter bilis]
MKYTRLQGLYGISDTKLTPTKTLIAQLQKAIQGGLKIFQYRDKDSKDSEIIGLVGELQALCNENNVLFVLNDRYELAIKLGVSGLHLGKDEVSQLLDIRESFKGIIGVSCYDSIELAQRYESAKVDYVAFGSLFPSPTKRDAKPCPLSVIVEAKHKLKIPICGIGGICVDNVSLLKECDMIAVISSLWNIDSKNYAPNPAAYPNLADKADKLDTKTTACHTEPLGEVSSMESKKDFSPMTQNDNKQILDSKSTNHANKTTNSSSCSMALEALSELEDMSYLSDMTIHHNSLNRSNCIDKGANLENQDSSQNAPLNPAPTQAVKNQDSKNLAPFKAEDLKNSDYNYITANAKNLIATWQTK